MMTHMSEGGLGQQSVEKMSLAFALLADVADSLADVHVRREEARKHLAKIVELGDGLENRRDEVVRAAANRTDDDGSSARAILEKANIEDAIATVARARTAFAMLAEEPPSSAGRV